MWSYLLVYIQCALQESRLASFLNSFYDLQVEEFTRRPTVNGAANPETKKRNKRLFGALLGTLQQFQ